MRQPISAAVSFLQHDILVLSPFRRFGYFFEIWLSLLLGRRKGNPEVDIVIIVSQPHVRQFGPGKLMLYELFICSLLNLH
jgi:hypothetical protein